MLKLTGSALIKIVLGLTCGMAASLCVAQEPAVIAANLPAETAEAVPDSPSSGLSSSSGAIEPASPSAFVAAQPRAIVELPRELPHRFWDRENAILFTAVAATATADFFTTHANLASGGRELNPVTRVFAGSTPALAANFGLETASVIGISYMFHKTGHHTLERLTSFVDIGSSIGAVSYGLTHR